MGWRDILRSPDPSRALYLAMRANPTASRAADIFQGGFEGAMEGMGALGHAASIPARALAAAAGNTAGLGRPVDVSDYALYGRDLETGLQATQYGDLLAGTMEDAGELKPGGFASKVIRLAGNIITDPAAAPGLLSGAKAVGALAGRMTPTPLTPEFAPRMRPRGMVDPHYGQSPPAAHNAPPRGGGYRPPGAKIPLTSSPPPGPGRPGGITVIHQGPGLGFEATQPIPARLQGTGAGPVGLRTQPVSTFNPTATQEVPFHPDATQRVPMTRDPGGTGQLRPKARRKSKEE